VDPIVILLIGTMFLVFAYLLTWFDKHPDLAIKCQFLLMLGVIGVLGRFFWAFGFQQYIRPAALLVASAGVIWAQIRAGSSFEFLAGTTITVRRAFFSLAAVSEELFFIWGIMLGGISILSSRSLMLFESIRLPGELISLVGTSFLFALWHVAVYGTGAALQLMFIYRMLFGLSYLASGWMWGERYLGIPLLAHITINLIATS